MRKRAHGHIILMIVAISGTPGTGKTTAGRRLSGITGWDLVELNSLAEGRGLFTGFDKERYCRIVDMGALRKEVRDLGRSGRNLIIESHYAHDMDSDLLFVLRANPRSIRRRARAKKWKKAKTEENVQAEIMEVCRQEAVELGKRPVEIDTTRKAPGRAAAEMARVLQSEGLFVFKDMRIPGAMRDELGQPFGTVFEGAAQAAAFASGSRIISVGDYVSNSLISLGARPSVIVVDGRVNRRPYSADARPGYEKVCARNRRGWLTHDMWMAAQRSLGSGRPVRVVVSGEEDMAVLPFMMLSGPGSCIMYGLPGKGVCVIRTSDKTWKEGRRILKRIAAMQ